MEEPQVERRKLVTLPQVEFEAMVERAAERGARHALPEVGVDGRESARDISELRSLLDAFNEGKKTAGLTTVRMLFTELVSALLAGKLVKLKVFGGGQSALRHCGARAEHARRHPREVSATFDEVVRKMQRDAKAHARPKLRLGTGAMRRSRFCDNPMRRSISRCAAWY
jgi:hypothetical protein